VSAFTLTSAISISRASPLWFSTTIAASSVQVSRYFSICRACQMFDPSATTRAPAPSAIAIPTSPRPRITCRPRDACLPRASARAARTPPIASQATSAIRTANADSETAIRRVVRAIPKQPTMPVAATSAVKPRRA